MVYVEIYANYIINIILDGKEFKERNINRTCKDGSAINSDNRFGGSTWYTFYNVLEAKIMIAIAKVTYYELIQKETDEVYFRRCYGEMFKSLPKTRRWLAKQEEKYPEYFL